MVFPVRDERRAALESGHLHLRLCGPVHGGGPRERGDRRLDGGRIGRLPGQGTPGPPSPPPGCPGAGSSGLATVWTVTSPPLSGSPSVFTATNVLPSPTAKVTARAPKVTAAAVLAARAGRAKGAARPSVTGRGSGSRPKRPRMRRPRPPPPAAPSRRTAAVGSRAARSAGPKAVPAITTRAAAGDEEVHPEGDQDCRRPVRLRHLRHEGNGEHVAEGDTERGPDGARDQGLRHVRPSDLERGEAERLEDADAAGRGAHGAAHHDADHQDRHGEPEEREGGHERHEGRRVLLGGLTDVEVRPGADDRSRRGGGDDRVPARRDLRAGAGRRRAGRASGTRKAAPPRAR